MKKASFKKFIGILLTTILLVMAAPINVFAQQYQITQNVPEVLIVNGKLPYSAEFKTDADVEFNGVFQILFQKESTS